MSNPHGTPAIFPPFGPGLSRPAPVPAAAEPEPAPAAVTPEPPAASAGPDAGFDAGPLPWEEEPEAIAPVGPSVAGASADEDLPWLEVPSGSSRAADSPRADATVDLHAATDEADAADAWLPWETSADAAPASAAAGATSAETIEDDDMIPVGDLEPDAPAAAFDSTGGLSWDEPDVEAPAEPASASSDVEDEPGPTFAEASFDAPSFEAPSYEAPRHEAPAQDEPAYGGTTLDQPSYAAPSRGEEPPYEVPAPPSASAQDAAAPRPAPGGAFGEVADRLEAVARALREDPASFLSGAAGDPLALLVTGYLLGYQAGSGGNGPGNS